MSKYTPDFKYRAVLHYHQVHSQQRTAEYFNVSRTHLRRWIAAYRQGGIAALQHPQAHPMKTKRKNPFIVDKPDHEKTQAELIEELLYMRAENDYLKHMNALNEKEEKTVQKLRAKHPLKYLLHSAGIPKSSFHYPIGKPDPDAAAKTAVSEVYRQHKGRYGRRRIAAVLSWNKKKVGRIMGLLGLKAKVRSKKTYRPQAIGSIL